MGSVSAMADWTQEQLDAHFMELALRQAEAALRTAAAAWVNEQSDWARLEVVGDFMRGRAVEILAKFP